MVESPKTGSAEFGETVRRARERLGISRRDLAETTGLSYPYISQIETGYRMPSAAAMRSLSDALGLRPDHLFDAIPPSAGRDLPIGRPPAAGGRPARAGAGSPPAPATLPAPAPAPAPATRRADRAGFAPAPTAGQPESAAGGRPAGSHAGAADGWVANRTFRPMSDMAAPPAAPGRDRPVDRAVALLVTVPTAERLAALAEVQAQVVRSVIDDEVGRSGSR